MQTSIVWSITDENGNPVDNSSYEFSTLDPVNQNAVEYVIFPNVMTTNNVTPSPPPTYIITATVTLSASVVAAIPAPPINTPALVLPSIVIPVLTIQIPEIFIGSIGTDFGGGKHNGITTYGCFISVPASANIWTLTDLMAVLDGLKTTMANLQFFTKLGLAPLGTGLLKIIGIVSSCGLNIAFNIGDDVSDLNKFTIYRTGPLKNSIEAEDTFNSVLLISGNNRGVTCYEDKNFGKNNVWWYIDQSYPIGYLENDNINAVANTNGIGAKYKVSSVMTNFANKISSLKWN